MDPLFKMPMLEILSSLRVLRLLADAANKSHI